MQPVTKVLPGRMTRHYFRGFRGFLPQLPHETRLATIIEERRGQASTTSIGPSIQQSNTLLMCFLQYSSNKANDEHNRDVELLETIHRVMCANDAYYTISKECRNGRATRFYVLVLTYEAFSISDFSYDETTQNLIWASQHRYQIPSTTLYIYVTTYRDVLHYWYGGIARNDHEVLADNLPHPLLILDPISNVSTGSESLATAVYFTAVLPV